MAPEGTQRGRTFLDKGQSKHGQEKAGVLQEEIADATGRTDEDHRADTGRGPHGGRRSDGGPGGQGGQLLYQGVSVWNDQYGPHDPEHDRCGAETHPDRRLWRLRQLPGGDAAEAAGSGTVGKALPGLPGKDGAGTAAMIGKERLKARVSPVGTSPNPPRQSRFAELDYSRVHSLFN